MKSRLRALVMGLACSAGMAAFVAPADAQVVIMRKMMPFKGSAQPVTENPNAPPTQTDPDAVRYYSWVTSPWKQEGVCGSQGIQTRQVDCKRTDGTVVPDARCVGNGSGPKPSSSQAAIITATCTYQWASGEWIDPGASCGRETQTRDVYCSRSDGTVAADALCVSGKPASEQQVDDYGSCTYKWGTTAWSEPTNQCGASTQKRQVFCQRSNGDKVDDAACAAAGEKPASEQQAYVTSGCAANWEEGPWGKAVAACGPSIRYREVICKRADGVQVAEDQCVLEKPAESEAVKDYSTCIDGRTPENPWGWTVGEYGPPSTTCGLATRTRSVVCTDDDGGAVADSKCLLAKPESTLKEEVTSGCSYEWKTGEFSAIVPACGNTAQTRTVTCTRTDGKSVPDEACSAPKPSSTSPYTDYSACTFGWAVGNYGAWSSTCGAATQTRTVQCQRSDGTVAADAECTRTKPADTQSSYQTSGCTFSWQSGQWNVPQACGPVAQTRTVQCVRSDGEVIDDATCLAVYPNKPVASQDTTDYTTCSYTWAIGSWGPWSTTCGTASSTRSVTCQRSDGSSVPDAQCASLGVKPANVQNSDQSSTCTYSWKAEAWANAVPACGATVQNRTVNCQRSDGTNVATSFCTGTKPATQQAATDYSTCNYSWSVGNWGGENLCGDSAIQTRTVSCSRSDGATATNDSCIIYGAGPKPAASQAVTTYAGCSYNWRVSYGTWSSTCSDAATRINTVSCQRSDGQTVDDSMCAGQAPSRQDTQGVYSSCSYTPTYSTTFGECKQTTSGATTGIETAPIVSCTRSDGAAVANSFCNPQVKSQSCTISSDQRYIRMPSNLREPNYYSQTRSQDNAYPSGEMRFVVTNTLCYDTVSKTNVSVSFCSSLPTGANVYDIVSIPATYLPDLREVWVSPSDMLAANPRGTYFSAGYTAANFSSTGINVIMNGAGSTWTLRSGTPDSSNHYERAANVVNDPVSVIPSSMPSRWSNVSDSDSVVRLAVSSTICRDTTANQNVAAAKCAYLPSGANVYDLVSLPATYVKELREVWVSQSDLASVIPYGGQVAGNSVANACSGFSIAIGSSTNYQSWTVRCGTPDRADRYVRSPSTLIDPASQSNQASQKTNASATANVLRMMVGSTRCYDAINNVSASAAKCTYLSTGANVYDLVSIPATFVKDLREIWVTQADLQNALVYGTQILGNTVAYVCTNGSSVYVYADGTSAAAQSWTVRCGEPDSPANYVRVAGGVISPTEANPALWVNTSPTNTDLKLSVRSTSCIDLRTGKSTSALKCTYLPSGANIGDILSIPASYEKDLREIYIDRAQLAALVPYGQSLAAFFGNYIANACGTVAGNGTTLYVGTSSGSGFYANYRLVCDGTDSASNYVRAVAAWRDPYDYYNNSANRMVNDTNKGVLTMSVGGAYCTNKTTGQTFSSTKCLYLPASYGPVTYDLIDVPAVWDVAAKTVTIKISDLKALSPFSPDSAYTGYICSGSVGAYNGAVGNYKVKCQ